MGNAPICRAVTVVLLYFTTTVSLWAEEQAPLLERLSDPKDWIIGFVVGVAGGLAAVVLLSFRVPKLKISILKPHPGKKAYTILVINKRKWWWLVTGVETNISSNLQRVTKYRYRANESVKPPILLLPLIVFIIPYRHLIVLLL